MWGAGTLKHQVRTAQWRAWGLGVRMFDAWMLNPKVRTTGHVALWVGAVGIGLTIVYHYYPLEAKTGNGVLALMALPFFGIISYKIVEKILTWCFGGSYPQYQAAIEASTLRNQGEPDSMFDSRLEQYGYHTNPHYINRIEWWFALHLWSGHRHRMMRARMLNKTLPTAPGNIATQPPGGRGRL